MLAVYEVEREVLSADVDRVINTLREIGAIDE